MDDGHRWSALPQTEFGTGWIRRKTAIRGDTILSPTAIRPKECGSCHQWWSKRRTNGHGNQTSKRSGEVQDVWQYM